MQRTTPPYRADHVGSLLRTAALKDARARRERGEIGPAELAAVEDAARFADADQLCLSPQCGFSSTKEGNDLTPRQQWDKLRLIVELAKEVWG